MENGWSKIQLSTCNMILAYYILEDLAVVACIALTMSLSFVKNSWDKLEFLKIMSIYTFLILRIWLPDLCEIIHVDVEN